MKQRVLASIRAHGLWAPDDRVAVAVSGGGDSMALLDLLVATAGVHRARLSVVSVDHGIHPDSASWAEIARDRAVFHGLPCTVHTLNLGSRTSEADARDARYAVLDALDTDRVALAHHARDQAETVLVNLLRGTGPRGLTGMPWRRGRYVRPVLDVDPAELARWRPTSAIDDPANADPTFLRARVRAEVLPLLDDLRAGAVGSLARSASLAREDEDLLDGLAASVPLTLAGLAAAPRPLARRRLAAWIGPTHTGVIEAVLAAVARGSGRIAVDARRDVLVGGSEVLILPRGDASDGSG